MGVTIMLPGSLKSLTGGSEEVICECGTVGECIDCLSAAHPDSKSLWFNEQGQVSPLLMIFLNGENVRHLEGLGTQVKDGDRLAIIPLAAGG
ncbi:MAG: MoaD family protein [Desulfomonilaceae bacterium]|nr:MoaD family protein [Desulfomonilaceae bacterium]